MTNFFGHSHPYQNMNCHPDRSEAKWSDCGSLHQPPDADGSAALPFVIPSAAEGSAVPRTFPGNVIRQSAAEWICSSAGSSWKCFSTESRLCFSSRTICEGASTDHGRRVHPHLYVEKD